MDIKEYEKRQDLLGLAQDIHGAFTGSFPDLSDERLEFARRFIKVRLDNWTPEYPKTLPFDTAVKMVLVVAVQEADIVIETRATWSKV